MLTKEQVKQVLYDILKAQNPKFSKSIDEVSDESVLRTDLGLDSIQMLYLVIVIEEKFKIDFDDAQMAQFKTFGDIINYIMPCLTPDMKA